MKHKQLFTLDHTENHVHIALPAPRLVLSSAVLNGGWVRANHIVNLRVRENFTGERTDFQPPEDTLADYSRTLGLSGNVVGLMTAASLASFRQVSLHTPPAAVTVLVTAGLSNAKQAGEAAEWRSVDQAAPEVGTINLILLTNLKLTRAAMVEAVMMMTEAKTVALAQLGVTSPTTGQLATGTGTDSMVVVNGWQAPLARYCGKHVLLGEMIARATIQVIIDSLSRR
jgi:adenosylcobinamide amidohydrolase